MIKMQQISFSGAGKPFNAKLQINFTSELFLKLIIIHIFLGKLSCWLIIKNLNDGQCDSKKQITKSNRKSGIKKLCTQIEF